MFAVFLAGWKLCLRRIVADYWVVVTAAVTVLLSVTALAAGPIYAESMYVAGARQRLLDAPVADVNVAVSSGLGNEQFAALDQRVTAALAPVVTPTGGAMYRSGVSTAFSWPDDVAAGVAVDGEQTPLAVFAFQEGIEQRARLMEGVWEGSDASIVSVVVSEASAVALGLQVGDRLSVQGRFDKEHHPDIEIVGIFRIDDPADSYWYDDELLLQGVFTGESFTTFGPLIVSRETFLDQFARLADFHWHALPDFDALTVREIPRLRTDVQGVGGRLAASESSGDAPTVLTQLDVMLADIERSLLATRSSVVILIAQLAILALYALLLSTGILIERRTAEAALLRARGAGVGQVGAFAALEGFLLVAPAMLAGPWLAAQSLRLLSQTGPIAGAGLRLDPRPDGTSYMVALVAGLACVAIFSVPAMLAARSPVPELGRRQRASLTTFWQRSGIDLALLAIAVVGFWQLRRYGAPISAMVQGRLEIDPILVASPALGLLAGAIIALRLIPLLARLAERWFAPRQRPVATLSAWQLARRPGRYTRPALLLILALGIGLFTLAFTSTWQRSQDDQANYQIGADVRAAPSRRVDAIPNLQLPEAYRTLDGVKAGMPFDARVQSLSRSLGSTQLVLLDSDQAVEAVSFRADLSDQPFADLMQRLTDGRPTIATLPISGEPARLALDILALLQQPCPSDEAQGPTEGAEATNSLDCASVELETPDGERLFATPLTPAIIIRDANGGYHRLTSSPLRSDGSLERVIFSLTHTLDDGAVLSPSYPIELVAIEFSTLYAPVANRAGSVTISDIVASDSVAGDEWRRLDAQLGPARWEAAVSPARSPVGVTAAPTVELAARQPANGISLALTTGAVGEFGTQSFARVPAYYSLRPVGSQPLVALPIIVSSALRGALALETDQQLFLSLGVTEREATVVGDLHSFPTLTQEQPFIIVADWESVVSYQLLEPGSALPLPDEYWLVADELASLSALEALQGEPFSSARVASRYEQARLLSNDPVALSTIGALWLGVGVAAIFATVGFVSSVAASLRERLTEFGLLRVLGLSRRQLATWLLAENGFLVVICLTCGSAVGLALAWLVLPSITVSRTATTVFPAPIVTLPWGSIIALQALIVLLLLGVSLTTTVLLRRVGVGGLLRVGEDL